MTDITIRKFDESYIVVDCDKSISYELSQFFTFEVPDARFTPAYRSGKWDGKIRLYGMSSRKIYAGLINHVELFAKQNGYSFENNLVPRGVNITRQEVLEFTRSLDYYAHGSKIELRDYQIDSIYQSLSNDRLLLLSPTSSGKSAMIGGIVRWHQKYHRRTLILVPTVSLVTQMFNDLDDYFSNSGWRSSDNCHMIMAGKDKNTDKDIVISTWQSVYDLDEKFFNEFDCIICDEAHLAKSKSITGIMEKSKDVPYRIGCTGTLDGTETNKLVLIGLFGKVFQSISTKELMDNGDIAKLKINCIFLQYSDEDKNQVIKYDKVKKKRTCIDYPDEIDFLVNHERRNKFIRNLACSREESTLVLFNKIEHGKILYDIINTKVGQERSVFLVYGKTDVEVRDEIKKIVEKEPNAITIASYGVFSTGISVRNIFNVIYASPSKSRIRNLQSIGRGLRKLNGKDYCTLYDIADDLSWKKTQNHTLKHAVVRINIYNEQEFDYKMMRVDLK